MPICEKSRDCRLQFVRAFDTIGIKRGEQKTFPQTSQGRHTMSMYYSTEELETITKVCAAVPKFSNLMFECAWKYSVYDRSRNEANAYLDSHKSGRPTKERERLQVECSRKFGEFCALLEALKTIAEAFGTIHAGTIHDEIMEIADGYDTINNHRHMLSLHQMKKAAGAC